MAAVTFVRPSKNTVRNKITEELSCTQKDKVKLLAYLTLNRQASKTNMVRTINLIVGNQWPTVIGIFCRYILWATNKNYSTPPRGFGKEETCIDNFLVENL